MAQTLCQNRPVLLSHSCARIGRQLHNSLITMRSMTKSLSGLPSHLLRPHTGRAVPPSMLSSVGSTFGHFPCYGAPSHWTMHGAGRRFHSQLASSAMDTTAVPSAATTIEGRSIVDVLKERGLVDAITNEEELRKATGAGPIKVYCGFDPTADSLHLGNLLGILVLVWFQKCGHTPVALLGGATARVGDPSGKSAERPVMDDATIEANSKGIEAILRALLTQRDAPVPGMLLNNLEWFAGMGFLEFLRDVGKFARMGTMLNKDSVKTRLDGDGMSFTEFSYQLLQGYDFVHLSRTYGVTAQIGGSDQWGNITAGTDLNRRILGTEAESAFGITFPLLLKNDGTKFGKSESGAVWLAAERLSPFKFYQHLFAVPDVDVIKFMKML
eukprot:CAMPEP_0198226724 /NCGR_PEP_ID=MMETSP1445-20131203/106349_1 /TAXON_ID=36898 /ORGANISM="Pyramimonas sp., Strain CCMP2087" /LENGTH=383 /DNA_ID=CAMNT_0043906595 /DNA_START=140 /DNA_END=1287 /DNA_ORIENTATION=-